MKKIGALVLCLVLAFLPAIFGSLFTFGEVDGSWYLENKPEISPPNWVFGPVWTVLYFLIGISLYFAWIGADNRERKVLALVFGANLVLNGLWSYLFFGLRKPGLAFVDLILMFASILFMIIVAGRIDRKAGWLLVPYLLWVGFAGFLNWGFLG